MKMAEKVRKKVTKYDVDMELQRINESGIERDYLRLYEVCRNLAVSRSTLHKMLRNNELGFIWIGKVRRVSKYTLAEYKAERRVCG